ncbi:MAG: universal stress protein, partial [bacterium]
MSHVAAVGFALAGVGWYFWHRRRAREKDRTIQPEYGFADRVQEIQQHWALAEKRRSWEEAERAAEDIVPAPGVPEAAEEAPSPAVVAVVEEERPNKHLLTLAAAAARRYEASVEALLITEVPLQSPLTGSQSPPAPWWRKKLDRTLRSHPVPSRFHHVMARDRARGVLSYAQPGVRIILLDWHEEFREMKLRGSYVDRVLRRSPVRVGVLKYRGHKKYERILVATAGGPYAPAEVELADAVASYMDAHITFLMVLPPEASEHRETQALEYLDRLNELTERDAELKVVRGDSVSDEILAAGAEVDLIVLGATRQPTLRHIFGRHLVGPIADEIAERADGSVLVTRDPGAASRVTSRVQRWIQNIRRRLPGTAGGEPARPGEPGFLQREPEVEPFPREETRR